jgi:hypothetical protein
MILALGEKYVTNTTAAIVKKSGSAFSHFDKKHAEVQNCACSCGTLQRRHATGPVNRG